jgi:hypothetical protein
MPIQLQGFGGVAAEVDGSLFRALRATVRPIDYSSFGHYKASVVTGSMAAGLASGSEILQFRWTDATRLAVITKIHIDGWYASTAFVAGAALFQAFVARSWSADGSGGTALTMTGNNQKLRTSMGSSLVGSIRAATTAALGAGTKTLDTQSFGQCNTHTSAGEGAATPIIGNLHLPPIDDLYNPDIADGEHPLVLAANEGFAVKATVPGTGVWVMGLTVRWAEVTAY